MITCHELDRLMTPFIDGACSEAERAAILAHLEDCRNCQARAEAESTAKNLLHAHAAIARTLGVPPPWRPRVFRLGRPALPVHAAWLVLFAMIAAGALGLWLRPARVMAVGLIGDSFCEHHHRFTARFNVGDRECTLGCVKRGAEFVLVTDAGIYRIENQQLPALPAFANQRVRVEGTLEGDRILVANMAAVEAGAVLSP
jgi:hypothetical protein